VNFNLLPPGSTGEALFIGSRDGNRSTTSLPASGEYTIRVYQMGNAANSGKRSNFTLDVAIAGGTQMPTAAKTSAEDDMGSSATQEADLNLIRAGNERYEIPAAAIYGG
jgi:hypothetical protein